MNTNQLIRKIQLAINTGDYGLKVVTGSYQFWSTGQGRPITMYTVRIAKEVDGENRYEDAYKTAKHLFVLLFLRNLLFTIQEKEIEPTKFDWFNEEWEMFIDGFEL